MIIYYLREFGENHSDNIRRLVLIVVSLFLSFLLLACNSSSDETSGGERMTLKDVITDIDSIEELSIIAGNTSHKFSGGRVFAVANEEEQNTVVDYLFTPELKDFAELDDFSQAMEESDSEFFGPVYTVRIKTAEENYFIRLTDGEDYQYLWIINSDGEEVFLEGEEKYIQVAAETFPFLELVQYSTIILSNKDDINNSGRVEIIGEEDSAYNMNKGNSATIRNILDGTITTAASDGDGDADIEYDFKFTIGENVYLIDSQSGCFSRDIEGDISYAQLEDSWHERVLIWLRSAGPME